MLWNKARPPSKQQTKPGHLDQLASRAWRSSRWGTTQRQVDWASSELLANPATRFCGDEPFS
ncbi:hypothetical protein RBWH47_04186 [Rhodopirellula baltica WH47]|uniref:Uncharacterized protein n=1 Tax=Rhodopirellula baltica WH47 TaxID=991778 RepID=F2AS01_RHOBT|nr:hypothetical protein RBWH47_04186 [Rhodopirellula baltica WH47]